ncbi:MAG: hypothetical protein ACR2QC_07330 [Gammaproteobacteria bacterium]
MRHHSAKKRRKHAKKQQTRQAPVVSIAVESPSSPPRRSHLSGVILGALLSSFLIRGAKTLSLFPQHPEVDTSVRAQREGLAQIWREVGGCMWTAFDTETARIRANERQE